MTSHDMGIPLSLQGGKLRKARAPHPLISENPVAVIMDTSTIGNSLEDREEEVKGDE